MCIIFTECSIYFGICIALCKSARKNTSTSAYAPTQSTPSPLHGRVYMVMWYGSFACYNESFNWFAYLDIIHNIFGYHSFNRLIIILKTQILVLRSPRCVWLLFCTCVLPILCTFICLILFSHSLMVYMMYFRCVAHRMWFVCRSFEFAETFFVGSRQATAWWHIYIYIYFKWDKLSSFFYIWTLYRIHNNFEPLSFWYDIIYTSKAWSRSESILIYYDLTIWYRIKLNFE